MPSTALAADTGLPLHHSLRAPPSRRGFLSGLAALPLIGGSVALLGAPSAVAEPVTPLMLEAYKTWLEYERRWLSWEMAADPVHQARYRSVREPDRIALSKTIDGCLMFVGDAGSYHGRSRSASPYTRAALVLSTVGCSWEDRQGDFAPQSAPTRSA